MAGMRTPWHVVTASVTGPNHVAGNVGNQDRFGVRDLGDGRQLFAVADGAGSRKLAERGAQFAVAAAVAAAGRQLTQPPDTLAGWLTVADKFAADCIGEFDGLVDRDIRDRLGHQSGPRNVAAERPAYGTTLLAVIGAPPCYVFLSVGDCYLVVDREPGGPQLVVSTPARENSGTTVFMTSSNRDSLKQAGVIVDERIRALALLTDGLYEALLELRRGPSGRTHAAAPADFRAYFHYFADPQADPRDLTAKIERDFGATSNDDKTIVLAVRRS
jgi:hypothetical protein